MCGRLTGLALPTQTAAARPSGPSPQQAVHPELLPSTLLLTALTWQRDLNVAWYGILLGGPQGQLLSNWSNASSVCNNTTCLLSPFTTDLPAGAYRWWVSS